MTMTTARSSRRLDRSDGNRRSVVFHRCDQQARVTEHDLSTKAHLARALAALLDCDYAGEFDPGGRPAGKLYVVPSDTLLAPEETSSMDITSPGDLFGGVVPHRFIATKVITHPLVTPDAPAPAGWSAAFPERVKSVVLPGFSVFSHDDALRAGDLLLRDGGVRLKDASGVGGLGQWIVSSRAELRERLQKVSPELFAQQGMVVERNLASVDTHSVGQVQVGDWTITYCGMQYTTRNNRGNEVYGGSTLTVVRGDFEDLLRLDLDGPVRTAVEQALVYHRAALKLFDGFYASRSNYDIAQGVDEQGRACSGVLEQSWRIGGASGAEIAALHAFKEDPQLNVVQASTHEVYGSPVDIPAGALIHYDGDDADVGPLTKFVRVEPYGRT